MQAELKLIETALIVIAVAVSLQTILLVAAMGVLFKSWNGSRMELERRLERLQLRLEATADAVQTTMTTIDTCAHQTSRLLHFAERVATGLTTATTAPRSWVQNGAASKLLSRWLRRRRSTAEPVQA